MVSDNNFSDLEQLKSNINEMVMLILTVESKQSFIGSMIYEANTYIKGLPNSDEIFEFCISKDPKSYEDYVSFQKKIEGKLEILNIERYKNDPEVKVLLDDLTARGKFPQFKETSVNDAVEKSMAAKFGDGVASVEETTETPEVAGGLDEKLFKSVNSEITGD